MTRRETLRTPSASSSDKIRTQGSHVFLFPHDPVGESLPFFVRECFCKSKVCFRVAIRTQIVRPIVILVSDAALRQETRQFDCRRGLGLNFPEVFVLHKNERVRLDLVPFADFVASNFFGRARIHHVLLHASMGTLVEQVKMNRTIFDG